MSRKLAAVAAAALACASAANAQTNLQTLYDFSRGHVTTTLEMFKADSWGDTFFFVDYDYVTRDLQKNNVYGATGSYMEISRSLNFWQDSALKDFSAHVEFNGGVGFTNSNFLLGVNYFMHSADFRNTLTLQLMYKTFNGGASSGLPLQFTAVWGMQDLLGIKGLSFSGFADVWGENAVAWAEDMTASRFVFISEPQLWYNAGRHFGVENLHIGGEVEISVNFAGYHGFRCRPCLGTKWIF